MPVIKSSSQPGSPATFASRIRSPDHLESLDGHGGAEMRSGGVSLGPPIHVAVSRDSTGSTSGESKAVSVLVGKLVNKLPCNSGIKLNLVEADASVRATVASLQQISRTRLPMVMYALLRSLETLAKYSSGSFLAAPLDTVHSQIYLLYVLNLCLAPHRRDPASFDDALARYALLIVLNYASQLRADIAHDRTVSPAGTRSREVSGSSSIARLASSISSHALGNVSHPRSPSLPARRSGARDRGAGTSTADLSASPLSAPNHESALDKLSIQLRLVVGYLTSSNWPLVMTRIRSRLSYLCTTIDDSPDLTDLYLVQWAHLDRTRLAQLIQEFSSSFLHIKRHAQGPVAGALRQTIWNWIDIHPDQFTALVESNRKIEGGPDVLFDGLYSASDISSSSAAVRTRAFYPLMAMLLVLCPDIARRVATGESSRGGASAKKASYFDSLKKGLGTNRGFEACASSCVDLLGAAARLAPDLDCGLKGLVPEFESDLRNALFNANNEISDPEILVDGLVGLHSSDHRGTEQILVKLLLSDDKRLIALQAAHILLGQQVPSLRREIASPLRSLIKTQAVAIVGDRSITRRPRPPSDTPTTVLEAALRVIIVDPTLADELTPTLASLMVGPSPIVVRRLAGEAVCEIMESLVGREEAKSFGPGLCTALLDACRQALHDLDQLNVEAAAESMSLLRDMLAGAFTLAKACPEIFASCPSAIPAFTLSSQCILGSLVILDSQSSASLTPSLKTVQSLIKIALTPMLNSFDPSDPKVAVIHSRLAVYDSLANMPPALGRQHYQRNFRNVARSFTTPSPVLGGLWTAFRAILRGLTQRIVHAESGYSVNGGARKKPSAGSIEGLTDDEARIWQDMLAVVMATSAICLVPPTAGSSIVPMLGPKMLPASFEEPEPSFSGLEAFVQETLGLMSSSNVAVKETVKDVLGNELPLGCSRVLFGQLGKVMSSASGTTEYITSLCDQAIAILRLTGERMPRQGLTGPVDVGELLLDIGRQLHRLHRDEAMRIRAKYCAMLEVVLERDGFEIGQSRSNVIFDWLMDWSVENRETDGYHLSVSEPTKSRELENASIKCLSILSDGLSLQPPGTTEDAQSVVRSRLFLRAYTYLVRIIERSADGMEEHSMRHPPSLGSVDRSATQEPGSLAIATLSNLLSSNLDVGLKHCLAMGYHEDTVTRTAFMQVLSQTLRNGSRTGPLGSLSAGKGFGKRHSNAATRPFIDALSAGSMALAVACVEACPGHGSEVDEMSTVLFRSCEAKGTLLPFLRVLVEREVALTNHESELFRANSITTRMLTLFARTYGYNYVRATLQPLIYSLIDKPAETSFELDPSKAGPYDDIERNAEHLKLMCQALLDLICSSTPRIPVMFRALCHYIWESVEDRYPESRHSAVGSFIFLRFFCPSIVAPDNIDLEIPADSRDLRRGLLLITKVIQNLANNVVFGNKEPHMKVLNTFLGENIRQVTKFLSDVAIRPRSHEIAGVVRACREEGTRLQDAEGDDLVLNRFIRKHLVKLETTLSALPNSYRQPGSLRPERSPLDGRAALTRLKAVLEQTGVPAVEGRLAADARVQQYDEFIRHNAGRATEGVSGVFYEGPEGQTGRRIFYFIVSSVGLADYELLGYRIFQLLGDVGEPFDLVLDMTGYSATTEVPLSWLCRMLQMCPPGILGMVNTLALYNPNTYTRRRMRRIITELYPVVGNIGKHVVAASSPLELQESIHYSSLALPERTMELAYEAVKLYTNFLLVGDHEMHMKVGVKVGGDCLQIASWRQLDLSSNIRSYIVDVIAFRDIDDLVPGIDGDADRLTIKYDSSESITLVARPDAPTPMDEIGSFDAARAARAEFESAIRSRVRETPVVLAERSLRPSDVPGTLLNMALLNLCAPDETLRLAAYGLVGDVAEFFKYDVATKVVKVSGGLLLPHHSLQLAVDISRHLAVAAPTLTLEFLKEWTIGFDKAGRAMQIAALHYIGPWLANLEDFARPSKPGGQESLKMVAEVIRGFISVTISEYVDLHLLLQEKIWRIVATMKYGVPDLVLGELLTVGVDAGIGSMRADCIADIMVSVGNMALRGKMTARLRKTIARTYLSANATLPEHSTWPEICLLLRLNTMLAFNPSSAIDAQLYLPETLHILTTLVGVGPLLVRQTAYGLLINTLRTLASATPTGEMDASALLELLAKAQEPEVMSAFGLVRSNGNLDIGSKDESDVSHLMHVGDLAVFLGEVLEAAAVSVDCANAWRARWMGFVAGTCFQHNPATQPQAFTVLGCLATEEVDDDLVFQVLVAMSSVLNHYTDADATLIISMLGALARVMPGVMENSRYSMCLFWLAVGILQMGHIPLFASGLDLLSAALESMQSTGTFRRGLAEGLLDSRVGAGEAARRLDQLAGVAFETDVHFSLLAVVWKGVRHPSTRQQTIDVLLLLLRLGTTKEKGPDERSVGGEAVPYFVGLLPVMVGVGESERLYAAAGCDGTGIGDDVFGLLSISDNSTALLVISLVVTIVQTAATDAERAVLYKLLAQASTEIPEVLAMMYDALIPRMITIMSSTSNPVIQSAITTILERAMSDQSYIFPSIHSVTGGMAAIIANDSSTSLGNALGMGGGGGGGGAGGSVLNHQKSYSGSISSIPSRAGVAESGVLNQNLNQSQSHNHGLNHTQSHGPAPAGMAVLDEMGMRGLGEMGFAVGKMDRVAQTARWVSALITSYTT